MSSQEQFTASNPPPSSAEMAYPDCPQCQGQMSVRQLSPAPRAVSVDEVIYGCDRCGTELKQHVRRTTSI